MAHLDAKHIKNLKRNDVVVLYVPVCDESYIGLMHGKFVRCKACDPYIDSDGHATTTLVFSRRIQTEPGDFFSSIPTNMMGCDLMSPLVFAEEEFANLCTDEALRKEFFRTYPTRPGDAYGVSESERWCWWQTRGELKRMLRLKKPPMLDFSDITVLPPKEESEEED